MLDAIILAGGKGTRLASVVSDRPKPMAEVAGRPFLEWLLAELRSQGVQRAVLSIGHLGNSIIEHFGDGAAFGLEIVYAREEQPLGTGGAIRAALAQARGSRVLAMNGDSYCRFDVSTLLRAHIAAQARATVAVTHVADAGRYGAVQRDPGGAVRAFREKDPSAGGGWINAGIYVLERALLEPLVPGEAYSIERDVLSAIAGHGLHSTAVRGPFIDIGTPESFIEAQTVLSGEVTRLLGATDDAWPRERRAERVRRRLHDSAENLRRTADACTDSLLDAVDALVHCLRHGGQLLICGNGGSAADAQHLAAEFVSRLTQDYPRPALPAVALTTDSSFLTAFANDIEFDGVFARQVEALGRPGDMLLCLSTSGNSRNCLRAAAAAHANGMAVISIGGAGGALSQIADFPIDVPARSTQLVQEATLPLYHMLVDLTERALFDRENTRS
jgi:D-glycero-alpha-D-manno-heptose 1-phosphate guanylyltransferase